MIIAYFDKDSRRYTSFYSEGDGNLEMYKPTEEEQREAKRRRMIRNAAIGAGAAALVAGGGLMYLNKKGNGSVSRGWRNVKTGWADKLSGGKISKMREADRHAQKVIKEKASEVNNLKKALNGAISTNADKTAEISRYRGVISDKNKAIEDLSGKNGMKNLAKGLVNQGKDKVKAFLGRITGKGNKNFE